MKQEKVIIESPSGLHARPATLFTQLAAKYASKVQVATEAKSVDAKSILGVLTLGASKGTEVTITAEGVDEEAAVQALVEFIKTNKD